MRYLVALVFLLAPISVFATAGLVDGVWFSENPAVDSKATTVYSVLHNQSKETLEGIATLIVDGNAVAAVDVRIGSGDIRKVGIEHTFSQGRHTAAITFTPQSGAGATHTELAARTIVVDHDTDSDGVGDAQDTDDDNDGILDVHDAEPLVAQEKEKPAIVNRFLPTSTTTATTSDSVFGAIEDWRMSSAETVQAYAQGKREALAAIEEREVRDENVDGFTPSTNEEIDKREQQIAAASAATLGFMLDKKFLFYAEIVVLLLGVLHILWVWIKALLKPKEVDEEY